MKNIYKTLLLLTLSGFVFTSCDEDAGNTGESIVDYTKTGATVSTPDNNITVSESDAYASGDDIMIPFTVTLAEATTASAVIDLVQTGGTADSDDYAVSNVMITPGNTTATGYIAIHSNGYIEGTETLELTAKSRANFNINDFVMNITIDDDYVNDHLDLDLVWEGSFTGAVGDGADLTLDFCTMDFDILIFDENLQDTGIYGGATGSCPEHATLTGLPDGLYYIVVDLYDNPLAEIINANGTIGVPLTFSWSQEYFDDVTGSFVYDGFTTDDTSGTFPIATVTIENGYTYTIAPY